MSIFSFLNTSSSNQLPAMFYTSPAPFPICLHRLLLITTTCCMRVHEVRPYWGGTLQCRRVQRLYRACLQSLEGRPRSSFPVVAFTTSKLWSPTVQFTLKLGAFPGCRASALLIPVTVDVEHMSQTRGTRMTTRGDHLHEPHPFTLRFMN